MRAAAALAILAVACGSGDMAKRLRPGGLYTDPSPEEVPEGGLAQAKNVVFRRKGIAEPRPGFDATDISGSIPSELVFGIFPFGDRRILATATTGLNWSLSSYNPSSGAVAALTDPWASASGAMVTGRVHGAKASGALFLTSEEGVLRFDSNTGDPVFAGLPQALQPYAITATTTPVWLEPNEVVAYRTAYVRELSDRTIRSAPSPRSMARGTSVDHSVELSIPLAEGLVAGDRVEIYRSTATSQDFNTGPTDEMLLRSSHTLTSGDISAGEISFDDFADDGQWGGAALYTNETQSSVVRANDTPPISGDLSAFQQMMFYGRSTTRHRTSLSFGVSAATGTRQSNMGHATFVGDVTSGSNVISAVAASDFDKLALGQRITFGTDPTSSDAQWPADTEITALDSGAGTVTVSEDALASASGSTLRAWDWISVDGTKFYAGLPQDVSVANRTWAGSEFTGSLSYVINGASNAVHAYEIMAVTAQSADSGPTKTLVLERRDGLNTTFAVRATKPDAFDVSVSYDADLDSRRDGSVNTIRWSKVDQPDHTPTSFQARVGDESPILRIIPTHNSLLVFKQDGVWRVTGESPDSLRIDEHDQSLRLVHPDLAVAADNMVFAVTNRGIVAVTDAGVEPLSDPAIDTTIQSYITEIREAGVTDFGPFAVADLPNNEVIFCLNRADFADAIFVYNIKTGAWSRWDLDLSIGEGEDPSFFAAAYDEETSQITLGGGTLSVEPHILDARETTSLSYDEDFLATISSVTDHGDGTNTVTISGANLAVGDRITKSSTQMLVTAVDGNDYTGIVISGPFTTGTCTCYRAFESTVQWRDFDFGDPDTNKFWTDATMIFTRLSGVRSITQGFATDVSPTEGTLEFLVPFSATDTGQIRLRSMPTVEHRRGAVLRPRVTIKQAGGDWALSGLHVRGADMDHRMGRASHR